MRNAISKLSIVTVTMLMISAAQAQPTREESLFLDNMNADGKVDVKEWARMHKIYERLNLASAKSYATEKFSEKQIETISDRRLKFIDPLKHPWVPATQRMMNTDVDVLYHKPNWHLAAVVDYDADGKSDTARIHTNGSQWAVIVQFGAANKPRLIALKTDGSGFEIFGAGRRILMSIPDLGSRLLLMHKGKPAIIFLGGE